MKNVMLYASRVALVAVLLGGATFAVAQDQDRTRDKDRVQDRTAELTPDQDRTRLRLRDQLHKDADLTAAELAAMDPAIAGYVRAGGDPGELRATVREAAGAGCRGACIAECVGSMNRAVNRGASAKQAREMVRAAVREEARGGGDEEKGARVRERVEARLTRWERDRDLDRDRIREREHDRAREQLRDPATGGGKGPGGR